MLQATHDPLEQDFDASVMLQNKIEPPSEPPASNNTKSRRNAPKASAGAASRVKKKILKSQKDPALNKTQPVTQPSISLKEAIERLCALKPRLTKVLSSMTRCYPKGGYTAPELLVALGAIGEPIFCPPHQANAMMLCEHLQWCGPHRTVSAHEIFDPDAYFDQYKRVSRHGDPPRDHTLWSIQREVHEYIRETGAGGYDLFMAMDRTRTARLSAVELQRGFASLLGLRLAPNAVRLIVNQMGASRRGVTFGLFYRAFGCGPHCPDEGEMLVQHWGRLFDGLVQSLRVSAKSNQTRSKAVTDAALLERVSQIIQKNRYRLYDMFVELGTVKIGRVVNGGEKLSFSHLEKFLKQNSDLAITAHELMSVLDPDGKGKVGFQDFFRAFGASCKLEPSVSHEKCKPKAPKLKKKKWVPKRILPTTDRRHPVDRVHDALCESPHNLYDIFLWMDSSASGQVSRNELREGLRKELGIVLTIDDCNQIMEAAGCHPQHGHTPQLLYLNFFKLFGSTAKGKTRITPAVARRRMLKPGSTVAAVKDGMLQYLVENEGETLYRLFQQMDTANAGTISASQLQRGLASYLGLGMRHSVVEEFIQEVCAPI